MSLPNFGPIAQYNSLTDPNLQGYFSKTTIRKHLVTNGLINKKGSIVPDTIYKYKVAQKDQKKHYRQMLAQAIVQEALDIERFRQAQIRNDLEFTAKKELVRRIRGQVNTTHNVPPLWPQNVLPPLSGGRPSTAPLEKADSSSRRSQSVSEIDDSRQQMVPKPPTHKNTKPYRRKYNKTNVRERPKSAKERSPVKRESSPCRITMFYHGKGVKIPFDRKIFDPKDQITVLQQHCGGENLIVYKGKLEENRAFSFESKRHKDYPFSLAIYINNTYDCRVSTCCEYRHTLNVKIGGSTGRFSIINVKGNKPCYSCLMKEYNKRVKGVTEKPEKEDYDNEHFDDDDEISVIPIEQNNNEMEKERVLEIEVQHGEADNVYDNEFNDDEDKENNIVEVIEDNQFKKGEVEPLIEEPVIIPIKEQENPPEEPETPPKEPKQKKEKKEKIKRVSVSSNDEELKNWNIKFYTKDNNSTSNENRTIEIRIVGEEGKSKKYKFTTDNSINSKSGKIESFFVKLKKIGQPKYVIVSITGKGNIPKLNLEKVELIEMEGRIEDRTVYVFKYNNLIEKDQVVTLLLFSDIKWKITLHTVNEKGSETDSNVYISLIGNTKESDRIYLKKSLSSDPKIFGKGSIDEFEFTTVDIGKFKQLRIGHDNSGKDNSWHLKKATLLNKDTFEMFTFSRDEWFSKTKSDKKIERILNFDLDNDNDESSESKPPSKVSDEYDLGYIDTDKEDIENDKVKWSMRVYTSEIKNENEEGTDSNVAITLIGTIGIQNWALKLDPKKHLYFEAGSKIDFAGYLEEIGELKKIKIENDGSGISPDWNLQKIKLYNHKQKKSYNFEVNRCLSKENGLSIELTVPGYEEKEERTESRNDTLYSKEDMDDALGSIDGSIVDKNDKNNEINNNDNNNNYNNNDNAKSKDYTSDDEFDTAKKYKKNYNKSRSSSSTSDDDLSESSNSSRSGSLFAKEGEKDFKRKENIIEEETENDTDEPFNKINSRKNSSNNSSSSSIISSVRDKNERKNEIELKSNSKESLSKKPNDSINSPNFSKKVLDETKNNNSESDNFNTKHSFDLSSSDESKREKDKNSLIPEIRVQASSDINDSDSESIFNDNNNNNKKNNNNNKNKDNKNKIKNDSDSDTNRQTVKDLYQINNDDLDN